MNRESNREKLVPRRSWFNYANRGRGIVPPNVTHLRLRATLSINEIESVQFLPPTIKTASRVPPFLRPILPRSNAEIKIQVSSIVETFRSFEI